MPVIIDGYNLLRLVENTDEEFASISDVQLCRILSRYLQMTRREGEIVFDGIGPPDKTGFNNINNLEVIFSGRSIEADTVIENKIAASTSPKRLIVVSSDNRLRKAARTRKAVTLKCDMFWKNAIKQLNRKRHVAEPTEKRHGLTQGETEQWLKLFDIEQ